MNIILTTERLQLRPCSTEDLTFLHTLWTNDRIRYFLFDDRIITVDEARSFIEISLDLFERYHYGLWLVYYQTICIGFAGFLNSEETPTLLYGIHPQYWGQGYATEAAKVVLEYGLKTLNFPFVTVDVDEPNVASIRVLQKLGLKQIDRAIVNDRPLLYFTT